MTDGEKPAFPRHLHDGMSLRDWFAGQALGSIPLRRWDDIETDEAKIRTWAQTAYAVADAMLAARSPQVNEEAE